MSWLTRDLHGTVTVRWYAATLGDDHPDEGTHSVGATRIRYYEAIQKCLETIVTEPGGSDRISNAGLREAVVAEVGRRSSSTLYLLFRSEAPQSMLGHHDSDLLASQGCQDVVDNLISEAKVWTYWPHREGWLQSLMNGDAQGRMFVAETLVRVLADWAMTNRLLAEELNYAPPTAAIEDLRIVCGRTAGTEAVTELLARVLAQALDPMSSSPSAVVDSVHRDLLALTAGQVAHAERVVLDLNEALAAVDYLVVGMPDVEKQELAAEIVPQLDYLRKKLGGER